MLKATYLHHSGFLIETENYCLLFDYYTQNGRHIMEMPDERKYKNWLVFVSHGHHDHFDERIFSIREKRPEVGYVLAEDVPKHWRQNADTLSVAANQKYEYKKAVIHTLLSNDEGVAYLVEVEGHVIYHGGDLNWWHWNGESKAFQEEIGNAYCKEIDRIKGKNIDVAMIPVDLRLEDKYIWGLDYFMKNTNTKWAFPMHFWRRFEVCQKIQSDDSARYYKNSVKSIKKANETFVLE